MDETEQDFDLFRQHIQSSLNGDMGDEAQEEMIIALFKGHLKHEMGTMNVWAGNGVGTMRDASSTLVWS